MTFTLRIQTKDEEFVWRDLPDGDRVLAEQARDQFNLMQFDGYENLRIQGPNTFFNKRWNEITSIRIEG